MTRAIAARAAALAATWALIALPTTAAAGAELPRPGGAVAQKKLAKRATGARAYWTPQRMRSATPLTVRPAEGEAASPAATRPPPGADPILIPGEPPGGPKGSGASAMGSGLEAPAGSSPRRGFGGPIPYTSTEITDTAAYPNRTHGIVFFKLGRGDYSCSGTAVQSATQSVVMTAGHCVHGGGKGAHWTSHWIFVPGYQDTVAPFGEWVAQRLFTTKGWRKRARFSGDLGAASMSPNASGTLEGVVGSRGIAFNQPRELAYRAYGYPISPGPKFDGESLWTCDSQFGYTDPYPEPKGPPQSAIGCDMGAGASGGGWVVDDSYVNSVVSFGYTFMPDVLFGPYFGNEAAKVYAAAGG